MESLTKILDFLSMYHCHRIILSSFSILPNPFSNLGSTNIIFLSFFHGCVTFLLSKCVVYIVIIKRKTTGMYPTCLLLYYVINQCSFSSCLLCRRVYPHGLNVVPLRFDYLLRSYKHVLPRHNISILSVICLFEFSSHFPWCSLTSIAELIYYGQRFPAASFPLRIVRVVLWGANSTEF